MQPNDDLLTATRIKLTLALDAGGISLFERNLKTGSIIWEGNTERLLGYPPGGFDGTSEAFFSRVHPDDMASIHDQLERARKSGGLYQHEYRVVWQDRSIHWLKSQGRYEFDEAGDAFLLRGAFTDITESKDRDVLEVLLRAQLAQAAKLEAIGLLAGGVAHDFNNMLTVILGYSAMLEAPAEAWDERDRKYLREIEKAANRSKDITQQLLGFSRQQIIAPTPSSLNELVADLLQPLGRLIGEDVELTFHPQKDLWTVLVDHSQINQLLLNLAINARDALPSGGKLAIETTNVTIPEAYSVLQPGSLPGRYVMLAVSDNGTGMDAETMGHLFEPFFTTKHSTGGTGLGLATVFGIVKQNEGFINVYSQQPHGTTFRIYLPQIAGEAAGADVATPERPVPACGTILLVEDDELVRKMITAMLDGLGYTTLAAMNPQEAIELCARSGTNIQLVLSDVVMPGMDGVQLRERLLVINPTIKILLMSGYTSNVIVKHGILHQGAGFIQKPFTVLDLQKRLQEVAGQDPSVRPLQR